MEISLADERAFLLTPKVTRDEARARVDAKRTTLVAGTIGATIARVKPEAITFISAGARLMPFWHVKIHARTVYERSRPHTLPASGPEVQAITVLGQELSVDPKLKGVPLTAVERCLNEIRAERTFEPDGRKGDFGRYLGGPKEEIPDVESFTQPDTSIEAPEARASAVVRQVMCDVVKPVQAQRIHEERVDVEAIDLYFRPVYSFEYEWVVKGKRVVIDFDAITGETGEGGATLQSKIRGMLQRDMLFDVTADAIGMILPGGSIAVKLVKAVVDRK